METRRVFHEEIDDLRREVTQLFAMVLDAIDSSTDALLEADNVAIDAVIANDQAVDAHMSAIEVRVCELFARQAPMASDLRTLLTILRVIHDLERSGDHAVNIAKAALRLREVKIDDGAKRIIDQMRVQAKNQLEEAIAAFQESDVDKALSLADLDDAMDDLQHKLIQWVVGHHHGANYVQEAVQIALVGRYFERIADHAVNIGERVTFMVNGFG